MFPQGKECCPCLRGSLQPQGLSWGCRRWPYHLPAHLGPSNNLSQGGLAERPGASHLGPERKGLNPMLLCALLGVGGLL